MVQKIDQEWLVTVPEDTNFTSALTSACKGNSKVANVLNYFLYAAALEAKRQNLKKDEIEYIDVKRTLDDILEGLNRHNKTISKKTLHDKIVDLTSMSYLQSDGYHQTYRVFIKKIEAAFSKPPEADTPKLRGRHARKSTSQDTLEETEDCSFDSKVKSTILTSKEHDRLLEMEKQIVILTEEKSNLTSQMSNLTFEMSNLTSQMSNLTFGLTQERACREALEAKIASLYSIDTVIDIDSNTVGKASNAANPPTDNHKSSSKSSEKPKPQQPELPLPPKPAIVLTEEEQAVYDEWSRMPWFKSPPQITPTVVAHCKTLTAYRPTTETMLKVKNWATSKEVDRNGFYKGKAWALGNLVIEYPKWLSSQPSPDDKRSDDRSGMRANEPYPEAVQAMYERSTNPSTLQKAKERMRRQIEEHGPATPESLAKRQLGIA